MKNLEYLLRTFGRRIKLVQERENINGGILKSEEKERRWEKEEGKLWEKEADSGNLRKQKADCPIIENNKKEGSEKKSEEEGEELWEEKEAAILSACKLSTFT